MPSKGTAAKATESAGSSLSADLLLAVEAGGQVDAEEVEKAMEAFHQNRSCHFIVDSSADFAPAVLRRLGIDFIPLSYITPEGERYDDLWESESPHEFYEYLRKHPETHYSTSAVSPGRYFEVFERAAQDGVPTIYIGIAGGISSSIQNAETAAAMVREQYPDFELFVIDSRCDSASIELLTIEAIRLSTMGYSAKDLVAWIEDARYFLHGYFTLDSLQALAAGGRIPPAAASVGGKLDVKPELSFDTNGALSLRGMCRGRKKALRSIVADFQESYCGDATLPIAIVSSDAEKDADWLEAQIRHEEGCEDLTVIRSQVSPILGSHVGPGMVALIFWGNDRREKLSFTDRLARRLTKRS